MFHTNTYMDNKFLFAQFNVPYRHSIYMIHGKYAPSVKRVSCIVISRYKHGRCVDQSARHSEIGRNSFQKRSQHTKTDYRVLNRRRTDYRDNGATGTDQIRFEYKRRKVSRVKCELNRPLNK